MQLSKEGLLVSSKDQLEGSNDSVYAGVGVFGSCSRKLKGITSELLL